MNRILFIAPVNLNVRSGGGLAVLAYYNAVLALYPGLVDIVCPAENCYGDFSSAIPAPKRTIWQRLDLSPHRYKSFLRHYLKRHAPNYDLCIINGGIYAGNMMDMIHGFGLRIIVIHHNCEREFHMDNKTIRTLGGRTPYFVNLWEKNAYLSADLNCFLTRTDLELFQKYYGQARGGSFLLGVFEPKEIKMKEMSIKGSPPEGAPVFVIAGSLCTLQTLQGIRNFLDNYYELLIAKIPTAKIVLAGRNPTEEIKDLPKQYHNIEVIPNPDNMGDIVETADVFLCPTHVGGGLKLRVMDGLKEGKPVLVHRVSARGYEPFWGQPYFQVYSDQNTFMEGLETIMSCYKETDGAIIRDNYLQFFGFSAGRARMKAAIDHILTT